MRYRTMIDMPSWLDERLNRPTVNRVRKRRQLPAPIAIPILIAFTGMMISGTYGVFARSQRLLREGLPVEASYVASKEDPAKTAVHYRPGKRRYRHKEYRVTYMVNARVYQSWFDPDGSLAYSPQPNAPVRIVVDPKNVLKVYDPESLPWQNNLFTYSVMSLFSVVLVLVTINVIKQTIVTRRQAGDPTRQPPSHY